MLGKDPKNNIEGQTLRVTCHNCGQQNKINRVLCSKCGEQLSQQDFNEGYKQIAGLNRK